ncbi:benzoate/H(+) symporter BenE family transporter [Streptomyces synnematoformans]|uniref:Benzoate/H(+) symporter BenE family transporter n=1 Tax=Streptomyces synnematoformans TaxID=415721 RepID=A0ABN2X6H7_9ACTN
MTPEAPGAGPAEKRRPALTVSTLVAGVVVVVVSYTGPVAVVLQAARAGDIGADRLESWLWALSIGSGVTCVVLSLAYRAPVLTAWSTPGAALLVTALGTYSFAEAVGAYVIAAVLTVLLGLSRLFGTLLRLLPPEVAAATLAGILLEFGLRLFRTADGDLALVVLMLAAYLAGRRFAASWATALALLAGCAWTAATAGFGSWSGEVRLAVPAFTAPEFTADAAVGLALPLFLVTMASQNAPGLAVLNAAGYRPDADRLVTSTGAAWLALAPFGGHAINLAAITAAICTGPSAHPDPGRRYGAGVAAGAGYLIVGISGSTFLALFATLPAALVAATAGIALLGATGGALAAATRDASRLDSALIAFLVTASGVELLGVGSAFWGLLAGVLTHLALHRRRAG